MWDKIKDMCIYASSSAMVNFVQMLYIHIKQDKNSMIYWSTNLLTKTSSNVYLVFLYICQPVEFSTSYIYIYLCCVSSYKLMQHEGFLASDYF